MLDLRKLETMERRLAALHEAGHAVVARDMGMLSVSAEIWRAREPSGDRNSWVGHVRFLDILGNRDPFGRRMLGVAGLVAVNLYLRRDPVSCAAGLDTLSPSDLAMAGVAPDAQAPLGAIDTRDLTRACAAVAEFLRQPEIRTLLLRTARRLILEATDRYDGPLFAPGPALPRQTIPERELAMAG